MTFVQLVGISLVTAIACLAPCSIAPCAFFHFTYMGAGRLTSVGARNKVPMSEAPLVS